MTNLQKQWIKAIDLLIENYENNLELYDCPLCLFHCIECIWVKFTGKECEDWAWDNKFRKQSINSYRRYPTEAWRKRRLEMLKDWRKRVIKGEVK